MDKRVVLILVIAALVIAVASAAVYFYLQNRDKYPPGTYETTISETTILVESDPIKQVKLISTANSGQGGQSPETQNVDTAATQAALALTPVTPTPQPATVTPIPPISTNDHIFVNYTVVAGDTLYSIANNGSLNTTIALMARYGISAPDIYVGNILSVPVANPAKCPGSIPYVIRAGDTLYSISVKCGTTVDTVKQLNGISGDTYRLDETDVICVPNPPS